jgi:hypothetical protein
VCYITSRLEGGLVFAVYYMYLHTSRYKPVLCVWHNFTSYVINISKLSYVSSYFHMKYEEFTMKFETDVSPKIP